LLTEVERVCDRIAVVQRGRIIASGTVAELLGGERHVRLQLAGLQSAAQDVLARAGAVADDEPAGARKQLWYSVPASLDIPQLVHDLVNAGVAIYAVEPQRATLEQRFLELLAPENTHVGDRSTDPA